MFKLPESDKTAYLSLYVTSLSIDAHLVYSDYSIGRRYTLYDRTEGLSKDLVSNTKFWKDYFIELEKRFNWDIFRGASTELMYFAQEGIGVGGLVMNLEEGTTDSQDVINAIRGVSSDINIEIVGDNTIKDLLSGLSERLGYDDVIYIKADLKDFRVYRTKRLLDMKLTTPLPRNKIFSKGAVKWKEDMRLVELIKSNQLRAFMSLDYSNERIENMWANFVFSNARSSSEIINDALRSYITGQLLTIRNDNKDRFEEVGALVDGTAVIISGDMLGSIELEDLVLSIVDGLEVIGGIDLLLDRSNKVVSIAKGFSRGVLGVGIPISPDEIFSENYKLYIALGKNKKDERKVIFSGNVTSVSDEKSSIFGFSSEISYIKIPAEKERYMVEGQFSNGYKVIDESKLSFLSNPDKIYYRGMFLDGRRKPVVYGPDPRSNTYKLKTWLGEGIQ